MSYLQNFVFLFVFCIVFIDYGECDVFGSLDMDKSKMLGNNEVRCYCNMAECITTGYMCKSQRLGCFSDLAAVTSPSSIEMVTHGCLDLLDKNLQTTCRNLPGKSDPLDSRAPKSLLLCCTEDMCNDVDIPGNRMDVNNQVFNLTDPLFDNKMAGKVRRPNLTFTTELFFRLATFAVPVLGAIMMFMLVTLAVKLLRSDANEDRMVAMKLRQNDAASLLLNKPHFPNSSTNVNDFDASSKKVPLLYQYDRTHLPPASYHGNRVNLLYPILPGTPLEKNKTNAKLNNVSVPYNTAGANLEQPLLKINSGTFLQQGACNTFGAGSSLEQPLLKINSGNHLQQGNCNMFGAAPLYNGWGAFAANKLGGQTFGQDGVNISAALNQFVSNVEGSASQNLVDSLSTSVNIEEDVPCCVTGSAVGNNVDGVTPRSNTTSEVSGATDEKSVSGNVGATSSENLGNVPAIDGATGINVSVSNLATPMNVCATNHTNLSTASAATSESTSGTSQNTAETSGNTLETSAACFNPLETSKTNLPCPGYVVPCNISSTQGAETSVNLRLSTIPTQNLPKCQNVFPASSFVNANLPTVYGPFACVTTQATSDEHPIFSLQKSSELSLCSMNKCDCCNGCSSKCFEKNFSNHGCNLCQGVDNERLTTANSTASNNFDSEDDVKTNNYKKNLMPPFCAN